MKIYLATWLEEISQKNALDKTGKRERDCYLIITLFAVSASS